MNQDEPIRNKVPNPEVWPRAQRRRYGLRFRRSRLRQVGLLRLALDWLHVIREIHMVSSFQLTRSASLILAYQIDRSPTPVPAWGFIYRRRWRDSNLRWGFCRPLPN